MDKKLAGVGLILFLLGTSGWLVILVVFSVPWSFDPYYLAFQAFMAILGLAIFVYGLIKPSR
jgi:hypothetical protein